MAHSRAESTRSQLIQGSDIFEACTVVDASPSSEGLIILTCFKNGVIQGTPLRLKLTEGGQWAADYPGLSGDFLVDDNGHIKDG